ncbi:MAG: apolipoprotein N-acyltransferase [Pseudomonadota bacterium]
MIEDKPSILSKDILLAVCSGLLLIIIFPKFNLEIVAWFALIPLFYAIQGKKLHHSFYLGSITGFVSFLGLVYWVFVAVSRYGHLNYLISLFVLLLLVSYLSLFIGTFAFLVRYLEDRSGLKEVTTAPFIWVSLEYTRSFLFTGFPWESLGYSQFLVLPLVQASDITGVYGLSFLIVLVNALLFNVFYTWFLRGEKRFPREVGFTLLLLVITFAYGGWRLSTVREEIQASSTMKVAVIQGNIDQSQKWNPAFQDDTVRIYRDLSFQAAQSGPVLIVWPEAATPFYFQSDNKYREPIFEVPKKTGAYLLFGSPAYRQSGGKIEYFNTAFLISAHNNVLGRYDKVHLVPLGEYVPFGKYLYFIDKIVDGIGEFSSGKRIAPLEFPLGKFGVFICYEAIFPDLVRRFVKKEADFLVNLTNDAWFGETAAPYQHLSMVTFRAVENRVFIARAANTGISSIIDATGTIRSATRIFTREFLVDEVRLVKIQTFYTEYGDVFAKICMGITLIIIFREVLKSVKRRSRKI